MPKLNEQFIFLYKQYLEYLDSNILNDIRIFLKKNCSKRKNGTSFEKNTIIFDDDSSVTRMEINDILSTLIL